MSLNPDVIIAFINCADPDLAKEFLLQVKDGPYEIYMFDNGSQSYNIIKEDPDLKGLNMTCFGSISNKGWGPSVNGLLDIIRKTRPDCKAVWMCNDDITRSSQDMARRMYDVLTCDPHIAVASPACPNCDADIMRPDNRGTFKTTFIDFVAPMISMQAWDLIGDLDIENIGVGHGLDIDWCYRARAHDKWLVIDDHTVIGHPNPSRTCHRLGTYKAHAPPNVEARLFAKWGFTTKEMMNRVPEPIKEAV